MKITNFYPKKNKIFIVILLVTICFLILPAVFFNGREVFALDTGLDATAGRAGLASQNSSLPKMIGQIIYTILGFLGVIFIILLIYGGFLRMTAQGDTTKIQKSTGIITSAIVGVLIILASYTLTAFVLANIMTSTGGTFEGGCVAAESCTLPNGDLGTFNDKCVCAPLSSQP